MRPITGSTFAVLLWLIGAGSGPPITITVAARAMQPGELVVLTLALETPADTVRVRAFDKGQLPYKVDDRTWRVLVGIDLDATEGIHPVTIEAQSASGTARASYDIVVKPKAFPTRTLTVDEAFVNPPESAAKRIADEVELLNKTWADSAPTRLWSGPFIRPVAEANNSAFGTRSVYNGQPRSAHSGADFLSPAGTPVKAPNAGRVVLARDLYFTGNTVIVDHGLGLFSMFAHFSATAVHEGQTVATGDVVGQVGATGRVTGPHLHWAVRVGGTARVDPLSLLDLLGPGKSPETRASADVSRSARVAAVRFAMEGGWQFPRTNLVVVQDTTMGAVDATPVRQSPGEITRETEEIAKLIGPDVKTGWAVKYLHCAYRGSMCYVSTGMSVLVVSGLYEGETTAGVYFYMPGAKATDPGAGSSVMLAGVELERRPTGWVGVRYSTGPHTLVRR